MVREIQKLLFHLLISQLESGNIAWENASFLMPNLVLELTLPAFKDTVMMM